MDKRDLVGARILGVSEAGGRLWGVRVQLITGEIVDIETGDEFLPLAVTME